MSEGGGPEYVDYSGLICLPPAFDSLDTSLWGFWAPADSGKLDALCRRLFAEPSGGAVDWRPLGHHVMLSWGRIGSVNSMTPPFNERGAVKEDQVAVWIPVAQVKRKGDELQAERFAMFVSYIWLDNPMSLATGREVFGYPKSWGWPSFPQGDEVDRLALDVFGLNYGPGEKAARHPLIEIVRGDPLPDAKPEDLDSLHAAARHAHKALHGDDHIDIGLKFVAGLFKDLIEHRLGTVFLKQIRSIEDGTAAALQQIAEAHYTVKRFRAAPLLHSYEMTVHPLDSQPLGDELGLTSGPVSLAYSCEIDFLVGGGRVVWDAYRG
jgi:Acetoacetate decarboxylase (ADC)